MTKEKHTQPPRKIAVAGATGRVGRPLVARLLVARRGDSVRIEVVSDPEDPEQALYASGGLLPGPNAVLAGPTFEQWLDSTA